MKGNTIYSVEWWFEYIVYIAMYSWKYWSRNIEVDASELLGNLENDSIWVQVVVSKSWTNEIWTLSQHKYPYPKGHNSEKVLLDTIYIVICVQESYIIVHYIKLAVGAKLKKYKNIFTWKES